VTAIADDATDDAFPEPAGAEPAVDVPGGAGRREAWRWAALFVACYVALGIGWVFSNPPSAAPDEHHHLIKAIGMGRLDIGDEYDEPLPAEPLLTRRNLSITRLVEIPAKLDPVGYPCYAFESDRTAACMPDLAPADTGTIVRDTPIGAYPPFAYVPMGVAARAMDTPTQAFLAARLVALGTAAVVLFVGAWFLVRELGRAALLGAFVALTPMSVYAASSVTTSGLEIAGGFAVGALVVVCLRRPGALLRPRTQYAIAGVGSALVLSRQMGIVTLAVLLTVLAAAAWREVWQLVREHRLPFLVSTALLAASSLAIVWWERTYDHPTDTGSPFAPRVVDDFLARGDDVVHSAVGVFGWLDTPLPGWATVAWVTVAVAVCALALVVGDARERVVLAAVLVATAGVSFASYASVFYPVGASSQGRHLLPLFAFCPTFAGVVVVDRLRAAGADADILLRRLFLVVGVVAGAVQFVSLYVNARRYAVGTSGPVLFLDDAAWDPPLGWLPWLAVGLIGSIALAAVAVASRPVPVAPRIRGDA
jgi:hypothetical protein